MKLEGVVTLRTENSNVNKDKRKCIGVNNDERDRAKIIPRILTLTVFYTQFLAQPSVLPLKEGEIERKTTKIVEHYHEGRVAEKHKECRRIKEQGGLSIKKQMPDP